MLEQHVTQRLIPAALPDFVVENDIASEMSDVEAREKYINALIAFVVDRNREVKRDMNHDE